MKKLALFTLLLVVLVGGMARTANRIGHPGKAWTLKGIF
jgi:hypothetical protein